MTCGYGFVDSELKLYMERTFGYGSYEADCWFVGMEEGGGRDVSEIDTQVKLRLKRGAHELEDLPTFNTELSPERGFFRQKANLQRTWKQLIRIQQTAAGQLSPANDDLRLLQRDCWGRVDGKSCLIELFPLPQPSTDKWIFRGQTALPQLQERTAYYEHMGPLRTKAIRARLDVVVRSPKLVVFYGKSHLHWWRQIVGSDGQLVGSTWDFQVHSVAGSPPRNLLWCKTDRTLYLVVEQPAAHGVTNDYFTGVGQFAAQNGAIVTSL